jgi:hypothetical protein
MDDEEVVSILIKHALDTPEGRIRLATVEEFLIGEIERHHFNTEHAIEMYAFAINNSVRAWWVRKMNLGRLPYRAYSQSGLEKQYAVDLTAKFKAKFHPPIVDQRPPRRFLRFFLGA